MIDTLCIGGGGIKGISFVGALSYLEENDFININKINTFVGTSAGSILAFFLNIGFSIQELTDFVIKFNFDKFQIQINCNTFLSKYGIDTGEKMMTLIKTFLQEKYNTEDITFADLYNKTKKNLKILTTNYTLSRNEIFDHVNTPDVSVILAIRMSISVPFMFTPIEYNGNYYVDGGITCNFGLFCCNKDTTLGLAISNVKEKNKIESFPEYFINLCNILIESNTMNSIRYFDEKKFKFNYILIECRQKESMDFTINKDKINNLLEDGKISAKKYYSNFVINEVLNEIVEKISK